MDKLIPMEYTIDPKNKLVILNSDLAKHMQVVLTFREFRKLSTGVFEEIGLIHGGVIEQDLKEKVVKELPIENY